MSICVFRPGRIQSCRIQLALAICVAGVFSSCPAYAQSTWEKMKLQFLEQACKGGDQNSCQQLAKLRQKLSQQGQPQAQQQPQQQQSTAKPEQNQPQQAEATAGATGAPQQSAEPWTPPADDEASQKQVTLDPMKLPDVVGVRMGMTAQEALAAARKTYSADMYSATPVNRWPGNEKPVYGYNVLSPEPGNPKDMVLSFTAPPGPQIVWGFARQTLHMHINRATLLAALRQKYGKETTAYVGADPRPSTDDARITELVWLYDERGTRVPMPPSTAFPRLGNIQECIQQSGVPASSGMGEPIMPKDEDWEKNFNAWCSNHLVYLMVTLSVGDIVEYTITTMQDVPLAVRTSHTAAAWLRDVAKKQHQDDLERSREKKPVL